MLDQPNSFCQVKCAEWLPCAIPEHRCDKTCFPKHNHDKCLKKVPDKFLYCGHSVTRKCFEDVADLDCQVELQVRLPDCGHWMKKKCHQSDREVNSIQWGSTYLTSLLFGYLKHFKLSNVSYGILLVDQISLGLHSGQAYKWFGLYCETIQSGQVMF